jgi:hypothetical protein
MSTAPRTYDVAFSFRMADLHAIERLADLIAPLSSFVYARKQGEIVTKDGMETFGSVFGVESALNVVLYRAGYGESGWTVFERDTITGRCLKEGWDSLAMFKTDGSPPPKWVPATYIYGDFAVMDLEAIAGVIRYRAKQVGVDVHRESAADKMKRLIEREAFERETERLATSGEAFRAIEESLTEMFDHISKTVDKYATPEVPGKVGQHGVILLAVNLGSVGTYLNYRNQYGRVTGGELRLRFFDGPVELPGQSMIGQPNEILSYAATVTRTPALQWCWQLQNKPRSSMEVAEFVLSELVQLAGKHKPTHWIDRIR